MVPNWKVSVVDVPAAAMAAVVLAMGDVKRVCDCANWVTVIELLPGVEIRDADAVKTVLSEGVAV